MGSMPIDPNAANIKDVSASQSFPRSGAVGTGPVGPGGMGAPGMGGEQASPGGSFAEVMAAKQQEAAQASQQSTGIMNVAASQSSQTGPLSYQQLQGLMQQTGQKLQTIQQQIQARNIPGANQMDGKQLGAALGLGPADQHIGATRLNQMNNSLPVLQSVLGMPQAPAQAHNIPVLSQLAQAENALGKVQNQFSSMNPQDMNVSDMLRIQVQMQNIERSANFWTAATGEALGGAKQLLNMQL